MRISISQQLVIVAAMALTCFAGGPPAIPWYTIDCGGVMNSTSDDGRFILSGTIGQSDAGVMTGGNFKLTGGFWFETQLGDCNGNGVRDLGDHAGFVDCMSGPNVQAEGDCLCFETSGDGDVDLRDFAESQRELVSD